MDLQGETHSSCPFCGSSYIRLIQEGIARDYPVQREGDWLIQCLMCGARGPTSIYSPEAALDFWESQKMKEKTADLNIMFLEKFIENLNASGEEDRYKWLSKEELLQLSNRSVKMFSRLLAVANNPENSTLSFVTGDLRILNASYTIFRKSGDGIEPDFSKVQIVDYGLAVAMGNYEASTDSILYEIDDTYRDWLRAEQNVVADEIINKILTEKKK